jgi:hypothetical protein
MYCKLAASSFACKNHRRKPLGSRRKKKRIQGREKCRKGLLPATAEIVAINGRGLGYVVGSHGVVWPAQ